jgi:hypothetical protein
MAKRTTAQNVYHDPREARPHDHYARPPGVSELAADYLIPQQTLVGYRRGTLGLLAEPMSARPDLIPLGISMSLSVDIAPTTETSTPIVTQPGIIGGLDNSSTSPVTERHYLSAVYAEDNFTIRADSGDTGDGPAYSALGIYMGQRDGDNGTLMHMVWIPEAPAGVVASAIIADQTIIQTRSVKGACGANVANLASFATTGIGRYGVTFAAGDIVLLMAQTTAAQNGPYVVGAVTAGAAPLTRPAWWATDSIQPTGTRFYLQEGNGGASGLTLYVADLGGIIVGTDAPNLTVDVQDRDLYTVRGVVDTNVADTAAFAVSGAGRDGLTYVEGDTLVLVAQTTGAQSGPYVVGTVAAGTAPLTRPVWWMTGMVLRAKASLRVDAGTTWSGSEWYATLVGNVTAGTSAPAMYPRTQDVTTAAAVAGVATLNTLWILSTSRIVHSRTTTGGTTGTVSITTQTAGAGNGVLTLTSSSATETSTFTAHIQNG